MTLISVISVNDFFLLVGRIYVINLFPPKSLEFSGFSINIAEWRNE